jgi:predicted TIM-barrel fold metal-dependent hydrolase
LPNCYADTCPGWGRWVFEQRMPGLGSLDFRKILYGTDGAGDAYSKQERWWNKTILSLGKTREDCRRHLYSNAAALLRLP